MATPPAGPEDDQSRSARSADLLAQGRLPLVARERLERLTADSAYTSDLSVGAFAALRTVGFDPVGQVLGTSVYQVGYAGTWMCSGSPWGMGGYPGGIGVPGGVRPPMGPMGGGLLGTLLGGMAGGGMAGGGMPSGGIAGGLPPRPPSRAGGDTHPATRRGVPDYSASLPPAAVAAPLEAALGDMRRRALQRVAEECALLGGDGVVGLRLTSAPFPGSPGVVEFQAIGTAVRARCDVRPRRPFLTHLSGVELATVLRAGWVPTGLALGVAVVIRHDDFYTESARRSLSNVEIPGYTALVQEARDRARDAFGREARAAGGEAAVLERMDLAIHEQACARFAEGHDHVAEVTVVGTSLARFERTGATGPPTLAILRLSAQPRDPARTP